MSGDPTEITAARDLAAQVAAAVGGAPSFKGLSPERQTALLRDLGTLQSALRSQADPYALALDTPADLLRRRQAGGTPPATAGNGAAPPAAEPPGPRVAATETLAARAGALADEIDFPAFVAGLVHGTFDAIVDATIRQMEAFADLVSAVARESGDFTRENVTLNQARDWLAEQHPQDLSVEVPAGADAGEPRLRVRRPDDDEPAPWLADFGLEGEPLTDDLVEQSLVPAARTRLGESRLKTLATMVLLGMNRVNVRDGRIAARVRFRALARDAVAVDYAVSQDPAGGSWGRRGSSTYDNHATMVSTVGVNAQADTDIKVELFGEVEINFVSETLPLDRFADSAALALLERNARAGAPPALPAPAPPAAPAAPAGGVV